MGSNLQKIGIFLGEKTAVFPSGLGKYSMGRYGRIGEIQHGQIWPDRGNTAWADMA